MWPILTAIGSFFHDCGSWFAQVLTKSTPQRADFESVNNSWKENAEWLRQMLTEIEEERKKDRERDLEEMRQNRLHDRKRIAELEKEAEECRRFRATDSIDMEKLREEIRNLRNELASIRAAGS